MSSRPQRKRKTRDFFTPVHPKEERDLAKALNISLRPFPAGDISEDDIQDEEDSQGAQEDFEGDEDDFQDERDRNDRYEVKWRSDRQSVTVSPFNRPSGITKSLPS